MPDIVSTYGLASCEAPVVNVITIVSFFPPFDLTHDDAEFAILQDPKPDPDTPVHTFVPSNVSSEGKSIIRKELLGCVFVNWIENWYVDRPPFVWFTMLTNSNFEGGTVFVIERGANTPLYQSIWSFVDR